MRVLWLIDGLGPGGAENLMPPLLKRLSVRGVESRVCVLRVRNGNPIANEIRKAGIAVDVLNITHLTNPYSFLILLQYIRRYNPDIIHTQLEASDVLGTLVAKIGNIPSVATMHTVETISKYKKTYWRNFIRRILLGSFCSQIIAVSDATRQHYISLGIDQKKIVTLYNGIDLQRFAAFCDTAPEKQQLFNIPNDSIVLSTVSVLREAKGIQWMLSTIPILLDKTPNLYYVIVGDGEYRKELERKVVSLGLEKQVIFLGFRTDIPEILSACDLFVFPTLNDALPTVLLESMAIGKPIVASNVGGIPEILKDNYTGLLVPPADTSSLATACLRLLGDKPFAQKLAVRAADVITKRFNIEAQADALAGLYQKLTLNHVI